jgi:hypothetical protein
METFPASGWVRNTSPFGATNIQRGWKRSVANNETVKPAGARGTVPCGRVIVVGGLAEAGVANGGASELGEILNVWPGTSAAGDAVVADDMRRTDRRHAHDKDFTPNSP